MSEDRESDYTKLRFSGRKEDWPIWSTQFLALAQLKKFKRSLLGQELPPDEDEDLDEDSSDAETRKKSKARTSNERAYSALTLTCSEPKSFRIIYNAKTPELPSGNASLAWARLKTRFEPKTGATLTQLKREFTQSKLQKGESPDEWIERLESIRNTIEQILGKPHIDETDMMLHIINNLPDDYEVIIDRVTKELSNNTLTLESLQEDLQEKYERMKTKKGGGKETAFYSKQVKTKCHSCGKIGHKKENCWELESNKDKRPKYWKKNYKTSEKDEKEIKHNKNPNIVCWKCNKKGHIQFNCPENKQQESGMMASQKEEEASDTEVSFMAINESTKNSDLWIGDTGASTHMKNTLDGLYNLQKEEITVKIGNGLRLKSTTIGSLKGIVEQNDGTKINVVLNDVAYVPELTANLFSITKALQNGFKLSNEENIMILSKGSKTIKFDNLQKTGKGYCPGIKIKIKSPNEIANVAQTLTYSEAHQKLGHPGEEATRATAAKLGWKLTIKTEECEACPIGKARQKNLNKIAGRTAEKFGQVMASDISSIATEALGGRKYWLLVVDQYTSMKWSFFLKTKDEQPQVLLNFVKEISQYTKIENWKCDNAGENNATKELFEENGLGIKFELTARETPQQNGMVERAFATLYGRMRAMFTNAGLEKVKRETLWAECAATVTKLDNILVKAGNKKSPYEKFYGKPNKFEEHLKIFGEIGIMTKSNMTKIRSKISDQGTPCIFLGYAKDHAPNVYRMLKLDTNAVILTRDVVWINKLYWNYMGMTNKKKYDIQEDMDDEASIIDLIKDNDENEEKTDAEPAKSRIELRKNNKIETTEKQQLPRWQRNLQTFYNPLGREKDDELGEIAFLSMLEGSINEPTIFQEAWDHPDKNEREAWRMAIKKEFSDMIKREVWELINKTSVSEERSLIGSKWVFKQKKNGVHRARLVALGYSQIPGVDFSENYAPVVNDITMRLMLVLKMTNDWTGEIIDMETAFLYGDLEEEIYMTIPKGFEEYLHQDLKNKCLILKKSIYGLVQAARAWWKKFTHSLQEIGFERCASDNCLMMRINMSGRVILCIYVDDVCCVGDNKAVEKTIKEIETLYKIKRIGKLSEFIGVNIEFKNEDLFFTQTDTLK